MSPHLEALIGVEVVGISQDQDACTVVFEKGYVLAIFNPWHIENAKHEFQKDSSIIVGRVLSHIEVKPDSTRFNFGGDELFIDLRESVWTGPEAAILYRENTPIVVW